MTLEREFERIVIKSENDYENNKSYGNMPESINLKYWYKDDVVKKLSILKHHIFGSQAENEVVDFFKVCFSLASRKASNQRNSIYKIYRMSDDISDVLNQIHLLILRKYVRGIFIGWKSILP